jgi:hypothetical protein
VFNSFKLRSRRICGHERPLQELQAPRRLLIRSLSIRPVASSLEGFFEMYAQITINYM